MEVKEYITFKGAEMDSRYLVLVSKGGFGKLSERTMTE